jgi:hypothetical protein
LTPTALMLILVAQSLLDEITRTCGRNISHQQLKFWASASSLLDSHIRYVGYVTCWFDRSNLLLMISVRSMHCGCNIERYFCLAAGRPPLVPLISSHCCYKHCVFGPGAQRRWRRKSLFATGVTATNVGNDSMTVFFLLYSWRYVIVGVGFAVKCWWEYVWGPRGSPTPKLQYNVFVSPPFSLIL